MNVYVSQHHGYSYYIYVPMHMYESCVMCDVSPRAHQYGIHIFIYSVRIASS